MSGRAFAIAQVLTVCLMMFLLALTSGFALRLFFWAAGI